MSDELGLSMRSATHHSVSLSKDWAVCRVTAQLLSIQAICLQLLKGQLKNKLTTSV